MLYSAEVDGVGEGGQVGRCISESNKGGGGGQRRDTKAEWRRRREGMILLLFVHALACVL